MPPLRDQLDRALLTLLQANARESAANLVRQLCAVSGEFDYVLLLRAESAMRMNALLDEMGDMEGVIKTTTSVALAWKIDRT